MQGRDALGSTETVAPVRERGMAGEGRPGQHRDSGPCEVQGRDTRPGQDGGSGPCEGQGQCREGTPWQGKSQWPL